MGDVCLASNWQDCSLPSRLEAHVDSDWLGRRHHDGDGATAVQRHHLDDVKRVDMGHGHRCGRVGLVEFSTLFGLSTDNMPVRGAPPKTS